MNDVGPEDFDRMTDMQNQAAALRKQADLASAESRRQVGLYRDFIRRAHDLEEAARKIHNAFFPPH